MNKVKISFSNEKYEIEDNSITCELEVTFKYGTVTGIIPKLTDMILNNVDGNFINSDGNATFLVRGHSHCNEKDKFNERIGKHIARQKAYLKAYIRMSNISAKLSSIAEEYMNMSEDFNGRVIRGMVDSHNNITYKGLFSTK